MLVIRVVSHAGQPPARPVQASFDDEGGDIGRGADCTLVLPDPMRRLSRHHAQVLQRGGRHYIRQLGNGVPVEVDAEPLGADAERELTDGVRIRIGPWVLQAESTTVAPPAPQPATGVSLFDDLLAAFPEPTVVKPAAPRPPTNEAAEPPVQEVDLLLDAIPDAGAEAAPQAGHDGDPLAALQAGLGLPPALPVSPLLAGRLLRAALQGTLELMAARTIAKRELGAQGTLMRPRDNNPLKFSPDVDSALRTMLGPPQRGFMPPLQALDEAFTDLRAHELAVVAGMRAALHELLERFDPQQLEAQLAKRGLSGWSQTRREAQLWQAHVDQYHHLLGDLDGEFDTLFVRSFVKAYQAQLAQLAQAREGP